MPVIGCCYAAGCRRYAGYAGQFGHRRPPQMPYAHHAILATIRLVMGEGCALR